MSRDDVDPAAPHGRDDQGVPHAPYGYKADGTPRLSNRGRTAGAAKKTAAAPPKKEKRNAPTGPAPGSADAQKRALLELADTLLMPAALMTTSPLAEKRLGEKRAMAAAGSVIIVQAYAEQTADVVVRLAADRPGMLAWLERADDAMPWLALLRVGAQLGKALYSNFREPDPRLASAAAKFGHLRAVQMAQAIEEEAAAYGITDAAIEEVRAQQAAAMAGGEQERAEDSPGRQAPSEENGWREFADYRRGEWIIFGGRDVQLENELPNGGLTKWLRTVHTKGRSMRCGIWSASQRAAYINVGVPGASPVPGQRPTTTRRKGCRRSGRRSTRRWCGKWSGPAAVRMAVHQPRLAHDVHRRAISQANGQAPDHKTCLVQASTFRT
jgi:hypothetical protein